MGLDSGSARVIWSRGDHGTRPPSEMESQDWLWPGYPPYSVGQPHFGFGCKVCGERGGANAFRRTAPPKATATGRDHRHRGLVTIDYR
jgi:hypothetical protein